MTRQHHPTVRMGHDMHDLARDRALLAAGISTVDPAVSAVRKSLDRRTARRHSNHGFKSKTYPARRARAAMAWSEPFLSSDVFIRDDMSCYLCGVRCVGRDGEPNAATIDHVVPLSLGGAHAIWNAATCCLGCNALKGNSVHQVDLAVLLRLVR